MVANDVRHIEPSLRLTRRGRAVVLGLLVLLASVASAVLFTTASRAEEPGVRSAGAVQRAATGQVAARPTIVVQPGDTLWDIATREMPGRHGQAAVDELRRLNALDGYGVRAGDVLILPFAQ
jgi:Tfp pilus assembly protein FimV